MNTTPQIKALAKQYARIGTMYGTDAHQYGIHIDKLFEGVSESDRQEVRSYSRYMKKIHTPSYHYSSSGIRTSYTRSR